MEDYQRLKNIFDVMEEGHLLLEINGDSNRNLTYYIRECNKSFLSIFNLEKTSIINKNLLELAIMGSENYIKLTTMLEQVYVSGRAGKRDLFFCQEAIDATVVASVHDQYIDLLIYNWSKRDIFGNPNKMEKLLKVFVNRQLCYLELSSNLQVIRIIGDVEKVIRLNHDDIKKNEDFIKNFIYQKDYDLFLQCIQHLEEHVSQHLTMRVIGHYGERIWIRADLLRTDGSIAIIVENIDHQKKIASDYEALKTKVRTVQKMKRLGDWEWDAMTNQCCISEGLMDLLDVAPKEIEGVKNFYRNRMFHLSNESDVTMMGHENVYEYLKENGQRIWLSDKHERRYDACGNVATILGITQEITRDKELYDQIVRSNSEYEAIYHSMKAAILVVDVLENGHFVYKNANTEAMAMFDYSLDEIVGISPEGLMGELGQQLMYHYTNCTRNKEAIRVLERLTRDGLDYKLILLLSPTIEKDRVTKIVVSAFEHF